MEYNGVSINQLLQEAAQKGDISILRGLRGGQDPLLLRPLHVASKLGELGLTEELLRQNRSLAEELDPTDRSSPLHLASGNGHVEVVKALVSSNPCVCLARDVHGRNPAHVAAMKGRVLVLEELIRAVPAAARERVAGDTILHLCVKFNQLEAMRAVVATVPASDAGMLLNAKDGDGNTILHIAVADQRPEIMHFLLSDDRVKKNMQNEYGSTPMDMFIENNNTTNHARLLSMITLKQASLMSSIEINKVKEKERQSGWIESQQNSLMVVASLVATMAFQAGLTPPFLHHKNMPGSTDTKADFDSHYSKFIILNTIGLFSSMSSIVLLISGLPGRRFFMIVVLMMMWLALTCMAYVYGISLHAFTLAFFLENEAYNTLNDFYTTYTVAFYSWSSIMAIILLGYLTTWTLRFY